MSVVILFANCLLPSLIIVAGSTEKNGAGTGARHSQQLVLELVP